MKSPNLLVDEHLHVKVAGKRCGSQGLRSPLLAFAKTCSPVDGSSLNPCLPLFTPSRLQPVQAAGGRSPREQPDNRSGNKPAVAGAWPGGQSSSRGGLVKLACTFQLTPLPACYSAFDRSL